MKTYPEIQKLQSYFNRCSINIELNEESPHDDFVAVLFCIDHQTFPILVDDEYGDFDPSNQVLCLFLVLHTLELYKESEDFLIWCRQYGLDASNPNLQYYYKSLASIYSQVEERLGRVDSCITPLDYQLRTGVVQELLKAN